MHAWILDESPGAYRWGTVGDPAVGPGEVRVRVVASALNHMDLWLTRAMPKPALPHVPGCDVAGIVEAVGPGVTQLRPGDEVVVNPALSPIEAVLEHGIDSPFGGLSIVGEHVWGGHGEHVVVPERNVVARPSTLTWEQSAAYPLTYLTAYRLLRRGRASAGETMLVVGVGSGVSAAALALGRAMGLRVFATSRSATKREEALELGAEACFDSAADRWPIEVDLVVDSVGPATWDRSIRALRRGGRLLVCGGTSGPKVELNLPKLFFRQIEIIGSSMGSYEEFAAVTRLVSAGVPVHVDTSFPLDAYPKALDRLEHGEQLGKIVLTH